MYIEYKLYPKHFPNVHQIKDFSPITYHKHTHIHKLKYIEQSLILFCIILRASKRYPFCPKIAWIHTLIMGRHGLVPGVEKKPPFPSVLCMVMGSDVGQVASPGSKLRSHSRDIPSHQQECKLVQWHNQLYTSYTWGCYRLITQYTYVEGSPPLYIQGENKQDKNGKGMEYGIGPQWIWKWSTVHGLGAKMIEKQCAVYRC